MPSVSYVGNIRTEHFSFVSIQGGLFKESVLSINHFISQIDILKARKIVSYASLFLLGP